MLKDECGHCTHEPLADVRFVPVIGERGIEAETFAVAPRPRIIRGGKPGDASSSAMITRFGRKLRNARRGTPRSAGRAHRRSAPGADR